jgi:Lon protease-like protein
MNDEQDLLNFSNRCRLFPLPSVVLFPHAVLPLHIFEPRYRQMTEDALADDQLVTLVQISPTGDRAAETLGSPPVERVGCLGRILEHERLSDGRFNFLLLGRKRVRLTREVASQKPYRIAEAKLLDDFGEPAPGGPRRSELIAAIRRELERHQVMGDDLHTILDGSLSLGPLTDIIAHALGLPPEVKQGLLTEAHVDRRAKLLLTVLQAQMEGFRAAQRTLYPPPFSMN